MLRRQETLGTMQLGSLCLDIQADEEEARRSQASAQEVWVDNTHDEHHKHPPLHQFEHTMKFPVDLGMFFFGVANAGVEMKGVGGITVSVVVALVIGKILGIFLMGLIAVKSG